jgi:MFS family permease
MPQTELRRREQRLPPALNTFAANLSSRALGPVLPHVAGDFSISIATAASFLVLAFTFAVVQPVVGAAADLFGKPRLMACWWSWERCRNTGFRRNGLKAA